MTRDAPLPEGSGLSSASRHDFAEDWAAERDVEAKAKPRSLADVRGQALAFVRERRAS
jgi:hypothetical protein